MKQGDISSNTRSSILNAAAMVILENGVKTLTLEKVAGEAGISKGGLLYHFPSKRKLIEGMIKRLIDETESSLEQEIGKTNGNFLKAFIKVTIKNDIEQNKISTALFAAIANDLDLLKPLQAQYLEWQNRAAISAPSEEIGTLVRLTMDGLWISDLANLAPPSPEMRERLSHVLLSLIEQTC
jgi:AcrR family transcriptional regulator